MSKTDEFVIPMKTANKQRLIEHAQGVKKFVRTTAILILLALPVSGIARDDAAIAQAAALADQLQSELSKKLQAAMSAGGPVAAIPVCKLEAPAIAARLSVDGWQVRRVGTRVRNPATGQPDAWEQTGLAQFARRLRAGETPDSLSVTGRFVEPRGTRLRWMRPILTGPLCLNCHGNVATQTPELRAALRRAYPQDAATGYAAGELRGAFSVSRLEAGQ